MPPGRTSHNLTLNKRIDGFTLIESLIAITIFMIVVGALVGPWFFTSITAWSRGENRIELGQQGRMAMNRMSRDLREAGDPLESPTSYPGGVLIAGEDSRVEFNADLNANRVLDPLPVSPQETNIVFSHDSVNQRILANGQALAEYVEELEFHYYNLQGTNLNKPLTPGDLERVVRIQIEIKLKNGKETVELESYVMPRNLAGRISKLGY